MMCGKYGSLFHIVIGLVHMVVVGRGYHVR